MTEDTRYAEGLAVRRAVLGEAHVARASANITPFDADFQRFITEGAWGSVWSRPHFSRRERSVVTLALLAALGHHEEVALHVRATGIDRRKSRVRASSDGQIARRRHPTERHRRRRGVRRHCPRRVDVAAAQFTLLGKRR